MLDKKKFSHTETRDKRQRFAIRKFNVGVASVAVAAFFMVNGASVTANSLDSSAIDTVEVAMSNEEQPLAMEQSEVSVAEEAPATEVVAETVAEEPVVSSVEEAQPEVVAESSAEVQEELVVATEAVVEAPAATGVGEETQATVLPATVEYRYDEVQDRVAIGIRVPADVVQAAGITDKEILFDKDEYFLVNADTGERIQMSQYTPRNFSNWYVRLGEDGDETSYYGETTDYQIPDGSYIVYVDSDKNLEKYNVILRGSGSLIVKKGNAEVPTETPAEESTTEPVDQEVVVEMVETDASPVNEGVETEAETIEDDEWTLEVYFVTEDGEQLKGISSWATAENEILGVDYSKNASSYVNYHRYIYTADDKVYRLAEAGDYSIGQVDNYGKLIDPSSFAEKTSREVMVYVYSEMKPNGKLRYLSTTGEQLLQDEEKLIANGLYNPLTGKTYHAAEYINPTDDKKIITTEDGRQFQYKTYTPERSGVDIDTVILIYEEVTSATELTVGQGSQKNVVEDKQASGKEESNSEKVVQAVEQTDSEKNKIETTDETSAEQTQTKFSRYAGVWVNGRGQRFTISEEGAFTGYFNENQVEIFSISDQGVVTFTNGSVSIVLPSYLPAGYGDAMTVNSDKSLERFVFFGDVSSVAYMELPADDFFYRLGAVPSLSTGNGGANTASGAGLAAGAATLTGRADDVVAVQPISLASSSEATPTQSATATSLPNTGEVTSLVALLGASMLTTAGASIKRRHR